MEMGLGFYPIFQVIALTTFWFKKTHKNGKSWVEECEYPTETEFLAMLGRCNKVGEGVWSYAPIPKQPATNVIPMSHRHISQ